MLYMALSRASLGTPAGLLLLLLLLQDEVRGTKRKQPPDAVVTPALQVTRIRLVCAGSALQLRRIAR